MCAGKVGKERNILLLYLVESHVNITSNMNSVLGDDPRRRESGMGVR